MAWIYFPELAGSRSLSDLGSVQSLIVKSTDTVRASYCPECDRVTLCLLPYGTMCELSKKRCSPKSRSSTEVSRARTSASQDVARAWEASAADWLEKCSDLSVNFDLASCSWKTCQPYEPAGQTLLPASWPASGMTLDGRLFQRKKSELRTLENDGSALLPTLSASNYGTNKGGAAGRTGRARPSLQTLARKGVLPTLTLYGNYNRAGLSPNSGDGLATRLGGALNPMWSEWFMGFPLGMTELAHWVTPWFRLKRGRRS